MRRHTNFERPELAYFIAVHTPRLALSVSLSLRTAATAADRTPASFKAPEI
jgi:hypothetical protein